jgi:hypothetical protein
MKLLKVLAAIAFSLFTATAPAAQADPPAVVGRLSHIAGAVSFAPAQAPEDWAGATLNRPITTGDRLWTDSGGRAEMHVGSLAVRMGQQTSLDVLNLDDRTFQMRLAQGNMNLRVRRLPSDQLLEIATPSGAVVIRQPGSYRINVDPSGTAVVTARAGGHAEIFTGTSSFLVRDQQQATVSGTRQDLYAAQPTDEFDQWALARDQRKERLAATRYVPEEMTGYEDLDEHGTWHTVPTYGTVWRPRAVPAGWAPYRHGHWVWVSPWGWTWVDDAPWGYAPSHYGRWVYHNNYWAWAPGRIVERPVYAPALVAFVGGSNWSVSIGASSAPAVGWVPLGWREPYRPWYRHSHAHLRNVNVTHVTNVTNITNNVTNVTLVNRNAPSAVTVVSRENFVRARPVQEATVRVSTRTVAQARVTQGAPVAGPERASLAVARSGTRPPSEVRTRETVAVNTPPAPVRDVERAERKGKGKGRDEARFAARDGDDRPRVRVIDRQQRVELQAAAQAPRAEDKGQTQSQSAQQQAKAGERAPDKGVPQAQDKAGPPAQAKANERTRDKAGPQAERRVPAPPADVSQRPTFDRERRQVTPQQAEAKREERQERREQAAGKGRDAPVAQSAPREPEARNVPRPPQQLERQRAQQQAQEQARQREAQQREEAQQRANQQREAQQQAERQRAQQEQERSRQQADEQQARRQAETQRQEERRQRAQPQSERAQPRAQEPAAQQQARERAQEQAQQRAQQQAQQEAREQVERQQQAQQRAQAQAQQQAQQQAQRQAREQQAQQRGEQQAREQARQQQQAERAQQQAREQQAQRRAEQSAREQARQQQAERAQQQAQQRGPQQAQPQQDQERQQRRDQAQEKGGRERARQDKDKDKSEKG